MAPSGCALRAHPLGTINHSLLSVKALRNRQIAILGIVFIGERNSDSEVAVCEIGRVRWLGRLPRLLLSRHSRCGPRSKPHSTPMISPITPKKKSAIWHLYTQHALQGEMTETTSWRG
jgi:AAA domain